jgi:putative MATE family efflux protein
VLSFVAGSLFRVNDQYWIQHLGPSAQEALGAVTFLLIFDFAAYFVAIAGSMSLISRASGSGRKSDRDAAIRQALFTSALIGVVIGFMGYQFAAPLADLLNLAESQRGPFIEYVQTIHLWSGALSLAPLVSNIFISMGDSATPLKLQIGSVLANFILNPILIYHLDWDAENMIVGPNMGMAGAAHASGISRALALGVGLSILAFRERIQLWNPKDFTLRRVMPVLRVGLPSAASLGVYALVYAAIVRTVMAQLPEPALGGLSIGFNAFEGVAFPFYLGISVAGASLIGRNLGAGDRVEARRAVRSMRIVNLSLGLFFAAVFFFGGPYLVPLFSTDPAVIAEARTYVAILAISQVFVALEAAEEKVLLGVGHTRPIFAISVPGNLIRLPLAWFLAIYLDWGAMGVWWTINASTTLKAVLFHLTVRRLEELNPPSQGPVKGSAA